MTSQNETWKDCKGPWQFLAFAFTKRRKETWRFIAFISIVGNAVLLLMYTNFWGYVFGRFFQ